ncbi:ABC transporter ATP-binding protein [Alkalihalobacillus trypoxylicola]|uniref:ABC transporter ATP-binding protein n=2 Tax=Alkalihalobacillus trypoxylicola TaxID=519424 RepID=A0A161P9C2_9BACI|nr:ABC transporter ATP-binding protein [Alkalihalobacillus trypoxylicola]
MEETKMIVQTNKITKNIAGQLIFEDLTMQIKEREIIGLVGRNGSGKSTFMKLLAKQDDVDSGEIHWRKQLNIGYVSQMKQHRFKGTVREFLTSTYHHLINLQKELHQLEEIMKNQEGKQLELSLERYGKLLEQFSSSGGYEIESEIEKVITGLNLKKLENQAMVTLSGGESTKVELAKALLAKPDLLLLDEPTNHLDLKAIEWLTQFIQSFSGSALIISHDRYFLDEIVTSIIDLEDGSMHQYHTNYSTFVVDKEAKLLQEFHHYQEQQKKIKKMKEAIKRLRIWANQANPPNEGLHKRARNMERALERIEKISKPKLEANTMKFDLKTSKRSGKDVVSLEQVGKSFQNRWLFREMNFHARFQDKIAIIGDNGTGKSTLLKMMLGKVVPSEGKVTIGSQVKIGYLSQHSYSNRKNETILDVFREQVAVTEGEARNILARFLFFGKQVWTSVDQLSGGEKMRLKLAIFMNQEINLLILDEPTNHLDIDSKEIVEEALSNFEGTIIAVSHDRYFLNKVFTQIYWLESGTLLHFPGNYNWAREKKLESSQLNANPTEERKRTKKRHLTEKKSLKKQVIEIENSIQNIEFKLEHTSDYLTLQTLLKEKELLEEKWLDIIEQDIDETEEMQ